jgi:hypothetical protein
MNRSSSRRSLRLSQRALRCRIVLSPWLAAIALGTFALGCGSSGDGGSPSGMNSGSASGGSAASGAAGTAGSGSGTAMTGAAGGTGSAGAAGGANAGSAGSAGSTGGAGSGSGAGTSGTGTSSTSGSTVGSDAGSGATRDGGGSGANVGDAAVTEGGPTTSGINDAYCNYGSVPSGTAPAAWQDDPVLTPTGVNPYGTPASTVAGGYILISEGPNGPTQVPTATQSSILSRINADLKFETSQSYIHLPPWTTGAKATHYIDYLFVDTGLPNDPNAGGDSSYEGQYPDVETTSVAMTDMSQRYDLTHEFNHVLENSYGTILGTNVAWIQESHNNFLILLTAERDLGATPGQTAQVTLPSNVGYLDALVYQQPYAPIESCGINGSDTAINGPEDYFTDTTGYRYNDLFPLFVFQRVGAHFFAAVWEQAKTTEQVLQTMTRLLDTSRVQCMVGEYSARVALGDFMELSKSLQTFGDPGMYAATTTQNGWLMPSNTDALPRYTGRNNIPIAVTSGATDVSVAFSPDAQGSGGTPATMQLQLVYRATDGTAVYGAPVTSGTASIALAKAPKNGVVVAVITNITLSGYVAAKSYGWDPNETFGYKIQVTGGTPAATNKIYF